MTRPPTARIRAMSYLEKCIRHREAGSQRALPPIRELARHAGVSQRTMSDAVSQLKDHGILHTVAGAGIFVAPSVAGNKPEQVHKNQMRRSYKSEVVQEKILQFIESGKYPPGSSLPGYDQLCSEIGWGYRSIRGVLERLAARGLLERKGKGFRVASYQKHSGANSLLLITPGSSSSEFVEELASIPRRLSNFTALEQECQRAGLRLILIVYNHANRSYLLNDEQFVLNHGAISRLSALGIVLWITSIDEESIKILIQTIYSCNLPLSVLQEHDDINLVNMFKKSTNYFVMGPANEPGLEMGRYLSTKKIDKIAYVAPIVSQWSEQRYLGLLKGLTGTCIKVELFTGSGSIAYYPSWFPVGEVQKTKDNTKYGNTVSQGFQNAMLRTLEYKRLAMQQRFDSEREFTKEVMTIIDRLLLDPSLRIWVCQSDPVAAVAFDYLKCCRIPVPNKISIIGFDDILATRARRITSYSFRPDAYAQAILRSILDQPIRKSINTTVRHFPGEVIDRMSVSDEFNER